jgi:1,4-dihydroxy-2-naphthoate octaprenyltransferase
MSNSKEANYIAKKEHNQKCILMGVIAFILVGVVAALSGLLEKAGLLMTLLLVCMVAMGFYLFLPKYKEE